MRAVGRVESDLPRESLVGLPRHARLRSRPEFLRVYENGVRTRGRYMAIFALRREGDRDVNRLGVTASRRVGGAVIRSRCKRRLRELFRLHRMDLIGMNLDVVINAYRECANAPWEDLQHDYRRCMKRLRRAFDPAS